MLTITIPKRIIPASEFYNEKTQEFISVPEKYVHGEQVLHLEHSLLSLHKWEQKWCIPFVNNDAKTLEQSLDYIRCMTLDRNVNPAVYDSITQEMLTTINEYIDAPMTATWINDPKKSSDVDRRAVTAERIYYLMIAYNIPVEFEKWHLNSLIMLIRVCEQENAPKQKISDQEYKAWQRAENARRRAKYKSKG